MGNAANGGITYFSPTNSSSVVPADLQSAGFEPGDLQSPSSLLHHLVRIALPILQGDAHRVSTSW